MAKDLRDIARQNHHEHIKTHQRCLEVINKIPLNKILLIRATAYSSYRWRDSDMIVKPIKFNLDTLRCRVLAIELQTSASELMQQNLKVAIEAIRYSNIRSWREFDRQDAPLYINWYARSYEFNKMAFDKETL